MFFPQRELRCDSEVSSRLHFLSHWQSVRRLPKGTTIATNQTFQMRRSSRRPGDLGLEFHKSFLLGDVQYEMIPTGFCVGSAGLLIQADKNRLFYTGLLGSTEFVATANRAKQSIEPPVCDSLVLRCDSNQERLGEVSTNIAADALAQIAESQKRLVVARMARWEQCVDFAAALVSAGVTVCGSAKLRRQMKPSFSIGIPHATGVGVWVTLGGDDRIMADPYIVRVGNGDHVDGGQCHKKILWRQEASYPVVFDYVKKSKAHRIYIAGSHATNLLSYLGERGIHGSLLRASEQTALFPNRSSL